MLCKPTSRPSKYIFLLCYLLLKKVIKNISFNVFWIFKLHELRNGIIQHKKHLKFLSDHFAENEKEKRLPKKLKKMQNKYYPDNQNLLSFCRRTSLQFNVPHFSTKKESVMILKMTNFWWKNMAIFHDVRK